MARYRTGDEALDQQIAELVAVSGVDPDEDLVSEMIVSALRMGREAADRGELKLVNSALKELRYSFLVFEPYTNTPKMSMFGSARIKEGTPEYDCARELGRQMADQGWMVITGAGPGIMAAGIEGAGVDNSFGVNIVLPFESEPNWLIAGDPKLINFRYFFTRKLMFLKESHGFVLLPGGFGTMDETFELLTLLQTGRSPLVPVVLLDPDGSTYWHSWRQFLIDELAARELITEHDLDLFTIADSVEDAVAELVAFYRVYHSSRWVGRRLILRLKRPLTDAVLERLNAEFDDIVSGPIVPVEVTRSELDDNDQVELPRLGLDFDRRSYARLRQLIDVINGRQ